MKDFLRVVKEAKRQGCTLGTGSKHPYLLLPNGSKVFYSRTPTDRRATKNLAALLRSKGIKVRV